MAASNTLTDEWRGHHLAVTLRFGCLERGLVHPQLYRGASGRPVAGGSRSRGSAIEGELTLEVGVLAVAVGNVLVGEDLDEEVDYSAVELGAGDPAELRDGVVGADRVPVGVARRHHVVGIRDRDDPRQVRDLVAREPARVPEAVEALVVGEDDLADRAVAVDLRDDPRSFLGVLADLLPVRVGQLGVPLQDPVGEDELADVVQQAAVWTRSCCSSVRPASGRSRASSGRRRRCGARSSDRAGPAFAGARSAGRPGSRPAAWRAARARRRAPARAAARRSGTGRSASPRRRGPGNEAELEVGGGEADTEGGRRELGGQDGPQHAHELVEIGCPRRTRSSSRSRARRTRGEHEDGEDQKVEVGSPAADAACLDALVEEDAGDQREPGVGDEVDQQVAVR